MDITLSDALRRIKALKGDIARWSALYPTSNVWAEDQPKPAYEAAEIEKNLADLVKELVKLKTALALANSTATLADGMPLAEAIYRLAESKALQATLTGLLTLSERSRRSHVPLTAKKAKLSLAR
mgnify:CR=1 FL=1